MSTIKTDIPCPNCDAERVFRPLYAEPGNRMLICWHCNYTESMKTAGGRLKDGIFYEEDYKHMDEIYQIETHVHNIATETRHQLNLKDTQIRTLTDRLEKLEKWVAHQKEIKKFVGIEVEPDDIQT
jgi:predicted DsbA family dithiol-disulfide isomerase